MEQVATKTNEFIAHMFELSAQSPEFRAARRAECAILGHVSSGAIFLTSTPTHVCWRCLMRYTKGSFGYVETP